MCKCQECGLYYGTDIVIPDELWEEIKPVGKPEGAGLLCPSCIGRKIEMLGGYKSFHLSPYKHRDVTNRIEALLP